MSSVCRRGELYYLRSKIAGREKFLRLPDTASPEFAEKLEAARGQVAELRLANRRVRRRPSATFKALNVRRLAVGKDPLPRWLSTLAREARKRAKARDLMFNLTARDLEHLHQRAKGRCEVTGLQFSLDRHATSYYRPFAPSLDRINPTLGYEVGNVRLVCVITNAALNQWGDDAFWMMIKSASERLCGKVSHIPQIRRKTA